MTLRRAALAVALGLLATAAFEPWSVPGAMLVSVAGLFWLARDLADARARAVVALGALYALAFMGTLIWWMNAVSSGAYVGLVLAETFFISLTMLGLRAAMNGPWWVLTAPLVWTAGEWLRGTQPFHGFPWGRLAHSAIDTPFAAYARLLGMTGTTLVMAVTAAALLAVVIGDRRVVAAVGVVAALAIGWVLPTGVAGPSGTRQIAVVQGDVPGEFLTWPLGAIFKLHAAETERLVERVDDGEAPRPDLVIWPENATDVDPARDPTVAQTIRDLSRQLQAPILVGGIFDGPTSTTAINAGEVWTADGPGERYVKRRPVPYGEYVPGRDTLGSLVPRFDRDIPRDFRPGSKPGGLHIAGLVVGDTICYDIAHDGVVRSTLATGAQLLVVQTSNAAFTGTSQPDQQWDITRLRAIESGRWAAVASTNGISGVIDAHGDVVERAPVRRPATIDQRVELGTGTTPAQHVALPLTIVTVTAGFVLWLLAVRASLRARRERKRAA